MVCWTDPKTKKDKRQAIPFRVSHIKTRDSKGRLIDSIQFSIDSLKTPFAHWSGVTIGKWWSPWDSTQYLEDFKRKVLD